LGTAGKFLAQNGFGVAVVVVYAGATGDVQKDLVLTQLAQRWCAPTWFGNFGFDDTQLKTLGMGKKTGANIDANATPNSDSGWGDVEIIIYPDGAEIPSDQPAASKRERLEIAGAIAREQIQDHS